MGLLSVGTPLPWTDAKQYADHVRKHGIAQFLATFRSNKGLGRRGVLYWGDEVEYMLVHFDDEARNAALSLRGYDVLTELMQEEEEAKATGAQVDLLWRPEYARYMLEGTPGHPYGMRADELSKVQASMKRRRQAAAALLEPHEFLASITVFPRLGDSHDAPFLHPHVDTSNPAERERHAPSSKSLFIPDDAINPHPRFRTLTANIRERRGEKVAINLPIYPDQHTPKPFREPGLEAEYASGAAKPDHIYLDCMCFGMGCSCLQITLQASHICEARHLYDQLAVLSPIMLALTASSPIFRGHLVDVDCRWNVIAGAVDDRTRAERGVDPAAAVLARQWDEKTGKTVDVGPRVPRRIPKSRYDSISTYLSMHASYQPEYNDLPLVVDESIEAQLRDEGVDGQLARHIAHLFIRDPLVMYKELLNQNDAVDTDHFENLQSTNWQTMRFKPPPTTQPDLGWRVEFRSMEVQLTDFENAAHSVFIVLASRVILALDLDLYIPLSKVDENIARAQRRDAVLDQRFWFRSSVPSTEDAHASLTATPDCCLPRTGSEEQLTALVAAATHGATTANGIATNGTANGTAKSESDMAMAPIKRTGSPCVECSSCGDCTCLSSFAPRSRSNSPLRKPLTGLSSGSATSSPDLAGSAQKSASAPTVTANGTTAGKYAELTVDNIINGGAGFTGLIPLIRTFLGSLVMDTDGRALVETYLDFIGDRAAGRVATTANWMRQLVMQHPEYKGDSRVSPAVAYDVLLQCRKVTEMDAFPAVAPVRY
ncbi:glutamate-cysteine ligase-domain-containing protein [Blastocladiella britannica]|nr:glutamate-cysteine ligase-domain-containing protein [Blastocladiella britannica]